MPLGIIVLLGAFAGLTIYLGLPIAFLKRTSSSLKAFMSMLATGILVFLLYDVVSKASEPISEALAQVRAHHEASGMFFLDVFLFLLGLTLGSVGLVYFNKYTYGRLRPRQDAPPAAPALQLVPPGVKVQDISAAEAGFDTVRVSSQYRKSVTVSKEFSPHMLALIIATGIGLHNFSEGLAIGQSASTGALQLAIVLIIGFGLHNMTEGFGIAGPLTGQSVSWRFVILLGLIGGGPTFLGT
ncbi:MAG: ZIP family metal transporter, partial [Ktedonobacteraceae bacterium]|nr:ZIP family metal transporter [Ktedonobacteraceae bacterium]